MKKYTQNQKRAAEAWDRKSIQIHLKFSENAHPEAAKKLSEVESKTKYILELIEKDIAIEKEP